MLWMVYNLLFPVVFVCMLPKFISRMLKRGGYGAPVVPNPTGSGATLQEVFFVVDRNL